MPLGTYTNLVLAEQLLTAFDARFGLHPGFRTIEPYAAIRGPFQ